MIATLTLTPQPPSGTDLFGHSCIVCGELGVADMIANVLLFVPLGAGLALAEWGWRRTTISAAALSIGIELTQLLVVSGRFATLSDVLTNTTGAALATFLAAYWEVWLRPPPRVAIRLAMAAAFTFVGVLAMAAWALGRPEDAPTSPPRLDADAVETGHGYFAGHVTHVAIGDFSADHHGSGPVTIAAPARRTLHAVVQVDGWDARSDVVPLLYVYRLVDGKPWLILGQQGHLVVMESGVRAQHLRLRLPRLSLRRVPVRSRRQIAPSMTLDAEVSGDRLTLRYFEAGVSRMTIVRLSPTLGWSLLSPFPAVDTRTAAFASALWVSCLALPLGYWVRWVARGGRRGELGAAVAIATTLVVGLVIVPRQAGFASARPWEWVATIGGAAVGAVAAETIRRLR